jgi:hypothetical protein
MGDVKRPPLYRFFLQPRRQTLSSEEEKTMRKLDKLVLWWTFILVAWLVVR